MKKKLIPLLNQGQNTEGETSLPESWEVIENARLEGHPDYLRYIKRKGLEKKENCPINDVYIMDSYKENIFAIGSEKASIYNSGSGKWSDPVNMKQEYAQREVITSFIEHDFEYAAFSHAESQVIEHNGYIYHYYVTNSGNKLNIVAGGGGEGAERIQFSPYDNYTRFLDVLDSEYNYIETIWHDPSAISGVDLRTYSRTAHLFIKDGFLHMVDHVDVFVSGRLGWTPTKWHVHKFLQSGFTEDTKLFPSWAPSTTYVEGDTVIYNDIPWYCFFDQPGYTSTTNWEDHDKFWIPYKRPDSVKARAKLWPVWNGEGTPESFRTKYRVGDVVRRLPNKYYNDASRYAGDYFGYSPYQEEEIDNDGLDFLHEQFIYLVCQREHDAKFYLFDYPEWLNNTGQHRVGAVRRIFFSGTWQLYRCLIEHTVLTQAFNDDLVAGRWELIDPNLVSLGYFDLDDSNPEFFVPIVNFLEVITNYNTAGGDNFYYGAILNSTTTMVIEPTLQKEEYLLGFHRYDYPALGIGNNAQVDLNFRTVKLIDIDYFGYTSTFENDIVLEKTDDAISPTVQMTGDLFSSGIWEGPERDIFWDLEFYNPDQSQDTTRLCWAGMFQYELTYVGLDFDQQIRLSIGNIGCTTGPLTFNAVVATLDPYIYKVFDNERINYWNSGTGKFGYLKKMPYIRTSFIGTGKQEVIAGHTNAGGSFSLSFNPLNLYEISGGVQYFNLFPLSKPFSIDGNAYVFVTSADYIDDFNTGDRWFGDNGDRTNNRCYLIKYYPDITYSQKEAAKLDGAGEGYPIYPVASFAYGSNVPLSTYEGYVKNNKAVLPYFVPQTTKRVNQQLYSLIEIDFDKILKPQAVESFGSLIIAGNVVKEFDGSNLSENNFFLGPRIRWIPKLQKPAKIQADVAIYGYKAAYVHINKKGDRSISRVSNTINVSTDFIIGSLPGQKRTHIAIESCIVTSKKNVLIELYRTKGTTLPGEVSDDYYRVGSILSDPSLPFTIFEDSVADSDIDDENNKFRFPLLYNSGNVLENENIGGVKNMAVHNGRIFAQSIIDGTTFYSKQKSIGEAISFSIFLSIDTVGPAGGLESRGTIGSRGLYLGDIGALASMSGYLILMLENSIVAIAGDGADFTGEGSSFAEPQVISESQGCTEPQTIVNTPFGIVFKGRDSWYLLIESLQLKNIGEDISEYFNYIIRSSSLSIDKGLIYYFAQSQDGLDKVILVFDYKHGGKWYQYRTDIDGIVDSTAINGNIAIIRNTNIDNFYIQGDGYKDNGLDYSMKFRTGWLKLKMIQALKRISRLMVLGQLKSNDYTYELTEYSDFLATRDQWKTGVVYHEEQLIESGAETYICRENHTSTTFSNDLSNGRWRIVSITKSSIPKGRQTDFHVSKQKSDSFKFELEVKPTGAGTGETIEIENISLLVGVSDKRQKTGINNKG
jgi:hypothetical protein